MKIRVINNFIDLESNRAFREIGAEIDVSKERAAYLEGRGLCEIIKEQEQEVQKRTRKAKSAKQTP